MRPADKGSGVVLVKREDYIDKLSEEMTQSDINKDVEEDAIDRSTRMFSDGVITNDMKQYLIPRYPKAGVLKGNPHDTQEKELHIGQLLMELDSQRRDWQKL